MKKVVKLLIISLIAVLFAVSFAACGAGSNKTEESGIICKKYSGDDFYTVIGYKAEKDESGNAVTSLDISAAAQKKYGDDNTTVTVGRIQKGAFDGNATLKSVTVTDKAGDGVELTIDEGAFKNMRALKSITLPFIGACANSDAYYNETAPSKVKAVDKERSFGYIFGEEESEYASAITMSYGDNEDMTASFYIPVALYEVTVEAQSEINIPMYAFCGLSRISKITLVDNGNIKAIGASAFKNVTALKSVTIPASVEVIYDSAFENATALKTVTFAAGSLLKEIKPAAFLGSKIESIDISDTKVENIGNYAFAGNANLTEVKFGKTVKKIGAWIFAECDNLTQLTYTGLKAECGEIEGVILGLEGSSIASIKCSDGVLPLVA